MHRLLLSIIEAAPLLNQSDHFQHCLLCGPVPALLLFCSHAQPQLLYYTLPAPFHALHHLLSAPVCWPASQPSWL